MALFLTDDLLKSDKKRKKAPEGTASALTSISERDNPTVSLEQRLKDLEIVTNYHDIALRSLEAWSTTTAFLMDPDTEPAPILIKALSTYNETRLGAVATLPAPFGRPLRQVSRHADQPRGSGTMQREPSRGWKTKKGDKFLLRIRPHTSGVPAWNEAFHCQSSPRAIPTSRDGVADRETPRNSELSTFSLFLFVLSEDSGSTETAVRMSLRCPQVCATGRLERPLQVCSSVLRLAARRIMLVPHEWTLNHSRVIVVVVQRQDLGAFCDHRAYRHPRSWETSASPFSCNQSFPGKKHHELSLANGWPRETGERTQCRKRRHLTPTRRSPSQLQHC